MLNQDSSILYKRILLTRDLARQNEKLASLDSYPNFAPRIGFGHTADGDDRIMLGFSVALPFFDRNQAETAKSQAESSYSQAEADYLSSGKLQKQLDLLQQSSGSMAKQSLRYKTELLPLIDKAYLASEEMTVIILAILGAVSFTRPYAVLLSNDGKIGDAARKE